METLFSPIMQFLQFFLELFYSISENHGISIILLSFLVSILLTPLYIFADKIQAGEIKEKQDMAWELKPISSLRNPQERFFYTNYVYRKYNYHPVKSMRSLLGIAMQLPFFIGAYWMLKGFAGFQEQSFIFIHDLSEPDSLYRGLNILPIIMTMVNLLSSTFFLLGRANVEKSEIIQLLSIPLLFLVLLYNQASALVLYWTMNNVFSSIKYYIQNRKIIIKKRPLSKENILRICNKVLELLTSKTALVSLFSMVIYFIILYNFDSSESLKLAFLVLDSFIVLYIYKYRRQLLILLDNYFSRLKVWQLLFLTMVFIFISNLFLFHVKIAFRILGSELDFSIITEDIVTLVWSQIVVLLLLKGLFSWSFGKNISSTDPVKPNKLTSRFFFSISTVLALSFIYTPVLIYLKSPQDFRGLSLYSLIGFPLLLCLLILSVITVLSRYSNRCNKYLIAITPYFDFLLLLIIFYGYIFNLDLGEVRGDKFVQDAILTTHILKKLLLEISIITVVFYTFLKYSFRLSKYMIPIYTIVHLGSLILVGISLYQVYQNTQSNYRVNEYSGDKSFNQKQYLEQFNYSKEKNIVVLILDTMFAKNLEVILDKYPKLKKELNGFIWYKNTVSISANTHGSEGAMYGGLKFSPGNVNKTNGAGIPIQKLKTSAKNNLLNTVKKSGYKIFKHSFPSVKRPDYLSIKRANYLNLINLWNDIIKFTTFRLAPVSFKSRIYNYGNWANFITTYNVDDRYSAYSQYKYFQDFSRIVKTNVSKPTFRYIWLSFPTHPPFLINEEGQWLRSDDIRNGFRQKSPRARFLSNKYAVENFVEYIGTLKEHDIYENTQIILASDHGPIGQIEGIFAVMMVKNFDTGEKAFEVSDTPMSNADIPAILGRTLDPTGELNIEQNWGIDYTKFPDEGRERYYYLSRGIDATRQTSFDIREAYKIPAGVTPYSPKSDWIRLK
ncbi:YidC/Oxa1 family membrane protein insertase [Candidatus Haliotispira prima]|uniref:YidC/Oxa1 family membrane protein insertase n=1 Tax=Candidatus Haliotispira prima TaxID=3034016 RepID=A0ABY8ML55_9SPIO|nr:YidC/Oxa1 family membrane protein insertase [Candidatus Haliotispira prima]